MAGDKPDLTRGNDLAGDPWYELAGNSPTTNKQASSSTSIQLNSNPTLPPLPAPTTSTTHHIHFHSSTGRIRIHLMTSSLAAALAASKKDAAKPSDTGKNKLPSTSSLSSRPSSLMKYKQTHEVEKRNNTGEEDTSKATACKPIHEKEKGSVGIAMKNNAKCNSYSNNLEIIDDNTDTNNVNRPQREKHNTNKSIGKVDTEEVPTSAASVMVGDTATAGVVFVCDIPSDSDDEVVDNCKAELGSSVDNGHQNNNGRKETNKKRGDRKKNRRSNTNANARATDMNSPSMSEIVFLCDIPSDDSDDDGNNNNNNNRKNHREHRNNRREEDTQHRGRGRGRGEKDVAVHKVNSRNDDTRLGGGVPSRTGNINAASPTKGNERSHDQCSTTPLPITTSTGLMPTPWSTRAQGMKNNGTENRTTDPHIRHNNRPGSRTDRHSTDISSAQEWRSPIRHDDSIPTPSSSVVARATSQKNSTTTDSKGAAATPVKLEPTVLKGRWADEDSDSDDE